MRLENLREEFPAMPDEIRQMVAREVAAGLRGEEKNQGKRLSFKKAAVITLAATLAVGTTAVAGTRIYQWRTEKEGDYGLKAGLVPEEILAEEEAAVLPDEIPAISIEASYLPAGMVAADDGSTKYYYSETPYQGGISIATLVMDEDLSADELPVSDMYVTLSESLNLGGQEAVYLEKQIEEGAGIGFDKKIYLAFPKYWQILEIFVGEDVSKDEALKVAEGLQLTPTGETTPRQEVYTWSQMLQQEPQAEEIPQTAIAEEVGNIHKVGDSIQVSTYATVGEEEWVETLLEAKVTDVQIAEDLSLLQDADADLQAALGADGKLVENEISYVHAGNGIDSLDETVYTEKVKQRLAYVTVEYTNTSEQELRDVLFFGSFVGLVENTQGYAIYDRAAYDERQETDFVSESSLGGFGEMDYYDVHGGERDNNYIPSIQPGETVTVHMAKIVNEDELDKMYFLLDTAGGAFEFSEESLQTGYVDIRQ